MIVKINDNYISRLSRHVLVRPRFTDDKAGLFWLQSLMIKRTCVSSFCMATGLRFACRLPVPYSEKKWSSFTNRRN